MMWSTQKYMEGTSLIIGNDEPFCKSFPGDDEESITSNLSTSEIRMLEAVKKTDRLLVPYAEQEVRAVGRRSRQPVITRMLDLSLLDDTYAGITKTLLAKSGSWAFNTFNLDVSTGGRSLSYLLVHLFQEYGFVEYFKLDIVKVWHCFNLMEAAYHRHNPYHNSVHAADVTQAMHCFLQENKFANNLTPLEAMSSVIAAVAHDLDHPGVTQAFLVATSNHLVNLYHNSSVLENHHWRTAISCLSESGIFNHLEKETWDDIQMQIRSLILATDITRQKEFLARFKNYLSSESLDMEKTQYRHFALQIALKCADLCNPCRPWAISQRWSYQVCQEFYRQGAYERQLKLPVTPTFDCSRTKVAKIQADFFQFVVSPLFETWDHFLKTPLSNKLLENLQHNFAQWQQKITIQQASEDESAEKEIPQIKIDSSEVQPLSEREDTERKQFLSPDTDVILKQHRSKSDSGLTPGLLSPKIHMETYSTEELHPSTTLLSLSSITNTVQLRQVYAATKVESHLICPTVFQPLCTNTSTKEAMSDEDKSPTSSQTCDVEVCSNNREDNNSDNDNNAQCSVNISCTNGCGTPTTPEKSPILHVHRTKQRSQSLINDSEDLKHCSQLLQNRRASDFNFYLYNNVYAAPSSVSSISNKESLYQLQHGLSNSLSNDSETSNKSPSISCKTKRTSSLTSSNMCSNKQCSKATCICRTDSDKKIPSWCWHISRSFSAERPIRPTHDFDSPLPSGHGSSSSLNYSGHSRRRGSAPVTYSLNSEVGVSHVSSIGDIDSRGDLIGGSEASYAAGRRWSIPMEISDLQVPVLSSNFSENNCPPMLSTRRSSFGLLEPLLAVSTLETENTLRQSRSPVIKSIHHSCHLFSSHEQKDQLKPKDKTVTSSGSFSPYFTSSPQTSVQRRGSLPTDLYNSGENKSLSKEFSETTNQPSFLFEHAHRHGSPGDLLSVLIGPSGMLNTMHDIVSGQTISERPCTVAQNSSRRRSGGLEMLGGLWRSRTNDVGMSVGMASKLNLRRQLLEAWATWRMEEGNINPTVGTTPTISALGPQFVYQQRRGSVPLNVSLLSVNSENTLSSEQVS